MEPAYKRRRITRNDSPGAELHEQRARNDLRLKSAFESIFEKYGKDFSRIGDEIDLETGEIVVDHGHLSTMKSEVDPGREEDLYDELDLKNLSQNDGPVKSSASNKKSQTGQIFKKTICDFTTSESEASSRFTNEPFNPLGGLNSDTLEDTMGSSDDELGFDDKHGDGEHELIARAKVTRYSKLLSQIQPRRGIVAQLRQQEIDHTSRDDYAVEPAWRAPPLPNSPIPRQEDSPSVPLRAHEADRERSISPPGPSLWASAPTSNHSKNARLGNKSKKKPDRNKFSASSPSSKAKNKQDGKTIPSLSYEWSRISVDQTPAQRPFLPPSSPILASSITMTPTTNTAWTNSEDQLLHYLKYDARLPYSQIVKYYSSKSEAEIEDHWFYLQMAKIEMQNTRLSRSDSKFSISNANPAVMGHEEIGLKKYNSLSSSCKPLVSKNNQLDDDPGVICDYLPVKATQVKEKGLKPIPKKLPQRRRQSYTRGAQDCLHGFIVAGGKKNAEINDDMDQTKENHIGLVKKVSSIESRRSHVNQVEKTAKEFSQAKKRNQSIVLSESLANNEDIPTIVTPPFIAQDQEPTLKSTNRRASNRAEHEPPKLPTPSGDSPSKPTPPLIRKKKLSNSMKKPKLPKPNFNTTPKQSKEPIPGSSISHPIRIFSSASPEPSPDIITENQQEPTRRPNTSKSLTSKRTNRNIETHTPIGSSNSPQTKQNPPLVSPPKKTTKAKAKAPTKDTAESTSPHPTSTKVTKPKAPTKDIVKPTSPRSAPPKPTNPKSQPKKTTSLHNTHNPKPTPHHPPPPTDTLSDDELSLPLPLPRPLSVKTLYTSTSTSSIHSSTSTSTSISSSSIPPPTSTSTSSFSISSSSKTSSKTSSTTRNIPYRRRRTANV